MSAYSNAGWGEFLVAAAGAAAALAGLVFLGMSINIARILQFPGLPGRAGETIVVLANALAICLLLLQPDQGNVAMGLQVLLVGVTALVAAITIEVRSPPSERREYRTAQIVFTQLATVPFVIAGVSLLARAGGGLHWVVAGVVLAFVVGLVNGWILLVEILR
jgi:modulator of FtsH protease